jgi:hypothetical protein
VATLDAAEGRAAVLVSCSSTLTIKQFEMSIFTLRGGRSSAIARLRCSVMGEVIFIIQPYARRGNRIAALTPIRTADEGYAKFRAKRLASVYGNCGAVVLAQKLDEEGKLIGDPVVVARFNTTPEEL